MFHTDDLKALETVILTKLSRDHLVFYTITLHCDWLSCQAHSIEEPNGPNFRIDDNRVEIRFLTTFTLKQAEIFPLLKLRNRS